MGVTYFLKFIYASLACMQPENHITSIRSHDATSPTLAHYLRILWKHIYGLMEDYVKFMMLVSTTYVQACKKYFYILSVDKLFR